MSRTLRILAPLALLLGAMFVADCRAGASCGVAAPNDDAAAAPGARPS
jgi:hypothetical protein